MSPITVSLPAPDNLADALRDGPLPSALAVPGWTLGSALGSAHGLPGERLAQRAAQRSFLALKASFEEAAATLDGRRGQWLQGQVQAAAEPIDLWLLRGALTAALVAAEGVAAAGLDAASEASDTCWAEGPHGGIAGRAQQLSRTRARLERTLAEVFADAMDWPGSDFRPQPALLRAAA